MLSEIEIVVDVENGARGPGRYWFDHAYVSIESGYSIVANQLDLSAKIEKTFNDSFYVTGSAAGLCAGSWSRS
jgi:hypothetical protein